MIYIYIYNLTKILVKGGSSSRLKTSCPCWALRVDKTNAFEPENGHLVYINIMGWGSWSRTYQCCCGPGCSGWMWEDKICEGFVCRKCGLDWQKSTYRFSSRRSPTRSNKKLESRQKPITPLPGLGGNKNSTFLTPSKPPQTS